MEYFFHLIRENSAWIFGSTSLAAIVLAFIKRSKSSGQIASNEAKAPEVGYRREFLTFSIFALVFVALGTSVISISSINFNSKESSQTITSGEGSTNINATNSRVEVGGGKLTAPEGE